MTAKTAPFSMRLEPSLKDRLQALADAERRSLTNYVEKLLVEHVDSVPPAKRTRKGRA